MGCSWYEEWQSSNTNIIMLGWPCWANGPVDVEIHPGGAYTNEASMCIYNLITNTELSFRMGFTSMGSKETYWSNEVKLHILPPDTWLHNGKFYRDRNHDGKIDWEVSGTTWMGRADFSSRYFTNSYKSVMATLEATGQELTFTRWIRTSTGSTIWNTERAEPTARFNGRPTSTSVCRLWVKNLFPSKKNRGWTIGCQNETQTPPLPRARFERRVVRLFRSAASSRTPSNGVGFQSFHQLRMPILQFACRSWFMFLPNSRLSGRPTCSQ